jgi:4-amino-4-deoxy-L-arabinose transferase-like glycosyltransferase
MTRHRVHLVVLLAILLVAAALRLLHIDQPLVDAFSWRQASTAMMAENFLHTDWNIFFPEVNWTGPGPNYQGREFQTVTYLAALLYTLLGQHDWIGRAVAVTFGVWGVAALFLLVRRVWDEERALVSASVLAVLPGAVFIDRSFLPDPAMVALVTTGLWLFVLYLQTERLRFLLLAAMVAAWGFLTKIPGLIIGLPMLYATFSCFGVRRTLFGDRLPAMATFAVLTLGPVTAYYLWARHLALSYPPYHFAGAGNWVWDAGVGSWLADMYFLPRLANRFYGWLWTPLGIALVGIGLATPFLRLWHAAGDAPEPAESARPVWLFHWWMLAGLIYYLIGARELVNNPWNFHILNPAAAALAGVGVVSLANTVAPRRGLIARGSALLLWGTLLLTGQLALRWMYHPYAEHGRALGLALRELTSPGELVVTIAGDPGDPVAILYSGRRGWVFPPARPAASWGAMPEDDEAAIRMLDELRAEGASWFGYVKIGGIDLLTDHPAFAEHLERTCEDAAESEAWYVCQLLPLEGGLGEG